MSSCLIIVDLQNDFCEDGALPVKEGSHIVPTVNALIQSGRFDHVVYTQDWHPANHCSFQVNNPGSTLFEPIVLPHNGKEQIMWPTHCVQNTEGSALHKDLIKIEDAPYVKKGQDRKVDSYSGFGTLPEKTDLLPCLKARNVKTVYCVGLAYDYCVGSTAADAASNGFETFVLMDATKAIAQESTDAMDERLNSLGVKKIESSSLLE
mmetsp:Transcript_45566/g.52468  ORF Transcript_45566/g.52468 Transcript_45566/m.52468 type:complete len:207 (-) Transcript_45566:1082-1702(-)